MDRWKDALPLIWVALAIIAGVVEVMTLDLIFLMVAGGALLAALAAVVTDSLAVSLVAFTVGTLALLLGVRPPLRRYMERRIPEAPMHTAALIGRTAVVVAAVGPSETGRIRLDGELWSARLDGQGPPVAAGVTVRVVRIDGATAVVVPHLGIGS